MRTSRKRIALDEAEAGMTLADNLLDSGGMVLLPAGVALTDSSISSLHRRGITSISIEFEEPALSAAEVAALRQQVEQRLAVLFRRCGSDGGLGLIRQHARKYKLGDAA
jgi:hypothetical protein